ncbi:MAG: MFS transporter [Acidobacteria bacterium]|nr:MFS transporter [Acidobacteriota bacterium]
MLAVSLISYIDRNTLALLAPTILKETGLSGQAYGWIISTFSVAYMIGNPVWGRLLDRAGVRRGMLGAVSLWSLASAAHALAGGFWSFAAARGVLGFGEGATFPGGLRTAVQTLPAENRSRGIAVSYSGGSLGAVITPIVVTPIALWFGWRGAFWFTGLLGAAWVVLARFVLPAGQAAPVAGPQASPPRLADARLWSFMAMYALGGLPLAFVLYGAALYLGQALGKSQAEIGKVLWIPPLGWEVGYFFWGWVTDRFAAHGASIPLMRRLLALLAVLSLPLAAADLARSFPLTMALMFLSMFASGGIVIASMAYATGVYSSRDGGLIAGVGAGAWSALVAVMMPWFGAMFDGRRYGWAFVAAALCPPVGWVVWQLLSGRVERAAADRMVA